MSVIRGSGHYSALGMSVGTNTGLRPSRIEVRDWRAVASGPVCAGTLACAECDAPVSLGGAPRAVTDRLTCPFCGHSGPLRDFLSLARPSRPARVIVRVTRRAA